MPCAAAWSSSRRTNTDTTAADLPTEQPRHTPWAPGGQELGCGVELTSMQPTDDIYRAIFESFPGALAVITDEGRLRVANRAARLLGVDLEALPRGDGPDGRQTTLPLVDRAGAARVLVVEEHRLERDRLLAIDD